MKDFLESTLTAIKILIAVGTVFIGIIGFIYGQEKLKSATVVPSLEQKITGEDPQWFHDYKNESCSISALWTLTNIGRHNIEVKGIKYSLYAFPDEDSAEKGQYKDMSWGNVIKNKEPIIGPITLYPSSADLAPNEEIRRDILFNYYPDVEDPGIWFNKRRFAIRVDTEAVIKSYGEWCLFCRSKESKTHVFSRNQYYCKIKSNK